MRRRVLILVGSFVLISLVFYMVSWFSMPSGKYEMPGSDGGRAGERGGAARRRPEGRPGALRGEALWFLPRDERGRLEAVYYSPRWRKRDDGSYLLYSPCVEMRQPGGQRVYITAREGDVYAEEVAGGVNIRRGRLYGDVRIYVDRAKRGQRPSFTEISDELPGEVIIEQLEQRQADLIRIMVPEELRFNNELLELYAPGRVVLYSDEVDLKGVGLAIRWHEEPEELRSLRIERGGHMAVYTVPEQVSLISMPGTEQPAEEAPPEATTQPTTQPAGPEATPAGPGEPPVEIAAAESAEVTEPTETTDTAPAPAAEDAPPATDVPQGQNIYLAEFKDQVHVESGQRRMWGVDTLGLRFEWTRQADATVRQRFGQRGVQGRAAPEGPVEETAPPADAADAPVDGETDAEADAERRGEPVIITWRGALIIRPVDHTPTPSDRRYLVTGQGRDIHLADSQAEATCRSCIFRHPQQTGELLGDEGHPARLRLAGGQEIISPAMRFDIPAGKVWLDGPGRIVQDGSVSGAAAPAGQAAAERTGRFEDPVQAGSILWQGRMEANFGVFEVEKDGEVRRREYIRDATFYRDVMLTQGPAEELPALGSTGAPSGDYLKCDILRVWMGPNDTGGIAPESAVAKGNVSGRQEGSDIRAGRATVFFEEVEEIDEDGRVRQRLRPTMVLAEQDVKISDQRDPDRPITALADRVQSDLTEKIAVLFGDKKEAVILQGENLLAGGEIHLDQDTQSAVVVGPGHMRFLSKTDMDGNDLKEPRPINASWSEGMEYYGKMNRANLVGDVKLTSETVSMDCQRMRLLFEKDESPEAEPAEAEAAEPRPRMGLDLERYAKRRLAMVLAYEHIVLLSERKNQRDQLLRRMQLTGESLIYDVLTKKLTMYNKGTLIAEDYRLPPEADGRPRRPATREPGQTTLERPSQTAFAWQREMELNQLQRTVNLKGNVQMVHRSGDRVVRLPGLNIPAWGDLGKGRKSSLHCRYLRAVFAEPTEVEETKAAAGVTDIWEVGPRLGPLERFLAEGDVNLRNADASLRDGTVQIVGQRLDYDRKDNTAVVWGYLKGQPAADASLIWEDANGTRQSSYSSLMMEVLLDGARIRKVVTHGAVTGVGAGVPRE